jgi:plasmid stability protein
MGRNTIRTTVQLEAALHEAVRLRAAADQRSISDIVNDALREALREDEEDLAAFEERAGDELLSYEEFLRRLKADGTL